MRFVRGKNTFLWGALQINSTVKGCMSNDSDGLNEKAKIVSIFGNSKTEVRVKGWRGTRYYTQQCSVGYDIPTEGIPTVSDLMPKGCGGNKQKCHRHPGFKQTKIFGSKEYGGGIVHSHLNMKKQYIYYFRPCEWLDNGARVNLFATDLVLLGSLNDCSLQGIPQAFKYLNGTSYKMPTNLALTNMEDNSYLYGNGDDTICGKNEFKENTGATIADNTLIGTIKHYSGTPEQIEEEVEYVALTEAAGIAWNYTGPDQGEKDFDKLYQPGGHFLGLSCIHSETNLKSCINLERICEAGAGMSQRHEVMSRYDTDSAGEAVPRYKHLVPTGLISTDDIMGVDFRTMFATLNHNRLLSTNFDDSIGGSGYYKYDFSYMRTNGFDGLVSGYTSNNTPYNRNLREGEDFEVVDDYIRWDEVTSQEVEDVKTQTYTRTLESANRDYVMFRFGIDKIDRDTLLKKFILSKNGM